MVHGDAGRDLAGPVVEPDAVAEHAPDHRGHVVRLERAADIAVAHAASGAERHFAVLNVERRVREQIVVAGVVVMHVADDDILDPVRIDADRQEPVARRTQKLAPALFRHCRVEAGVEDQASGSRRQRPRRNSRAASARHAGRRRRNCLSPCDGGAHSARHRSDRCRCSRMRPFPCFASSRRLSRDDGKKTIRPTLSYFGGQRRCLPNCSRLGAPAWV